MAQLSWPFESIDTSETQFSLWARNLGEGVIDGKGFELEPFADSTGMNIKIKTGQSLVRGHFYDNTAEETLTIANADLTNPRIDLVVLKLDPTANSILLTVLPGTPNVSPSAPAPTQTDGAVYEQVIAEVYVGAAVATIAPEDVTDLRTILVPWTGSVPGSIITGSITVATLPGANITGSVAGSLISGSITTGTLPAANLVTSVSDKSADYTILAGDKNTYIRLTGATGRTFTIANVLAVGESVNFIQDGTGQITFLAGSGVTLNSVDAKLKTNKQYSGATVVCVASGQYRLVGDLAA
jgi:hypothetical protein